MKYKIGDKVRIVSKKTGVCWNSEGKMDKWLGKVMTIRDTLSDSLYSMKEDDGEFYGDGWCWHEEMIEGLAPELPGSKVVITTDGKTTLARLYDGKKVIKRAEAKCSPHDEFNFNVGAALAFSRLMGNEDKKPEPKGYNGKVVCIKTTYPWWTVGKVYEVKDGIITADNGLQYPRLRNYRYKDAEDVRHAGCTNGKNYNRENEFIPLVED